MRRKTVIVATAGVLLLGAAALAGPAAAEPWSGRSGAESCRSQDSSKSYRERWRDYWECRDRQARERRGSRSGDGSNGNGNNGGSGNGGNQQPPPAPAPPPTRDLTGTGATVSSSEVDMSVYLEDRNQAWIKVTLTAKDGNVVRVSSALKPGWKVNDATADASWAAEMAALDGQATQYAQQRQFDKLTGTTDESPGMGTGLKDDLVSAYKVALQEALTAAEEYLYPPK